MKELQSGEITAGISEYLTLDMKERDKLQHEFYKKEQNKLVKNKVQQIHRKQSIL